MASEIFTTEASAEPAVLQLKMWVYLRKTCSLVQPLHKHLGSLHHGYAARAPCTRSLCYLEVPSVMQLSTWASHLAKPPVATLLTQNPDMTFGPSILFKKRQQECLKSENTGTCGQLSFSESVSLQSFLALEARLLFLGCPRRQRPDLEGLACPGQNAPIHQTFGKWCLRTKLVDSRGKWKEIYWI